MKKQLFTIIITAIISAFLIFNSKVAEGAGIHKITVVTYNVHHCNPPAIKGKIDVNSIASFIRKSKADVAFLQEIDVCTNRVGGIDEAKELSKISGLSYYRFFKSIEFGGGDYGILILSRFPLDSASVLPLHIEKDGEPRVLGTASVKTGDNEKILLACTHLDLSAKARIREVAQIDSVISNQKWPVILGGDFNAYPTSDEIKFMGKRYQSSAKMYLSTFPDTDAKETIDYIFLSEGSELSVAKHKVIRNIHASDHLPVVVVLRH